MTEPRPTSRSLLSGFTRMRRNSTSPQLEGRTGPVAATPLITLSRHHSLQRMLEHASPGGHNEAGSRLGFGGLPILPSIDAPYSPTISTARLTSESFDNDDSNIMLEFEGGCFSVTPSGLHMKLRRGIMKQIGGSLDGLHIDEEKPLGRGVSAQVFLGRVWGDEVIDLTCAVKVFNVLESDQREMLLKELVTLVQGMEDSCPSLVKMLGAFALPGAKVAVVLEFMNRGCLKDLVDGTRAKMAGGGQGGLLPERVVAAIANQLLSAIAHLHGRLCLHNDIKPSNVLINSQGQLKLTDFGTVVRLSSARAHVTDGPGTVKYMAPERLRGERFGLQADLWSCGLLFLECASLEPLWPGLTQVSILQSLSEQGSEGLVSGIRGHMSRRCIDLVSNCLSMSPAQRSTADTLLKSPWFLAQGVMSYKSSAHVVAKHMAPPGTNVGLSTTHSSGALVHKGSFHRSPT